DTNYEAEHDTLADPQGAVTDLGAVIDKGLQLHDVDSNTLSGATVRVVGALAARDLLSFVNQNGISGSFDAASGTLTLSGMATVAQYEAALRSVRYTSLIGNVPGDGRLIEFVVNDGFLNSELGNRTIMWPAAGPAVPPPPQVIPTPPPPKIELPAPIPPKHAPEPVPAPPASAQAPGASGSSGDSAPQQPPAPP